MHDPAWARPSLADGNLTDVAAMVVELERGIEEVGQRVQLLIAEQMLDQGEDALARRRVRGYGKDDAGRLCPGREVLAVGALRLRVTQRARAPGPHPRCPNASLCFTRRTAHRLATTPEHRGRTTLTWTRPQASAVRGPHWPDDEPPSARAWSEGGIGSGIKSGIPALAFPKPVQNPGIILE